VKIDAYLLILIILTYFDPENERRAFVWKGIFRDLIAVFPRCFRLILLL